MRNFYLTSLKGWFNRDEREISLRNDIAMASTIIAAAFAAVAIIGEVVL